jgi:hypothetical protein
LADEESAKLAAGMAVDLLLATSELLPGLFVFRNFDTGRAKFAPAADQKDLSRIKRMTADPKVR